MSQDQNVPQANGQEVPATGITAVVLGMHRSGTSCLAHILNACGVYMGDAESPYAPDNLQGFGESPDAVAINNAILEHSGGSWKQIPEALHLAEETSKRMRNFLGKLRRHPAHGWKDPRTSLTFSLWRPLLAEYRIIVCFRHPVGVARSLAVRDGLSLEEGYHLWTAYNERILESVNSEPGVLWFDFDHTPDRLDSWLRGACRWLGIDFKPEALAVFNKYQRHHQIEEMPDDPRVAALYERLLSRARAAEDLLVPSRSTAAAGVPGTAIPADNEIESLRRDIAALADIAQKHNALLQGQTREWQPLHVRFAELHEKVAVCENKLSNCENQLERILNSPGWKAYEHLQRRWRALRRLCAAIGRPFLAAPRLLGRAAASSKINNLRHTRP